MVTEFAPNDGYTSSSFLEVDNSPSGTDSTIDHLMQLRQLNDEYHQRLQEAQLEVVSIWCLPPIIDLTNVLIQNPVIYSAPSEDQEFNNMIINASTVSDHSSPPDTVDFAAYLILDEDEDEIDQ